MTLLRVPLHLVLILLHFSQGSPTGPPPGLASEPSSLADDGNFSYRSVLDDGSFQSARGIIKDVGGEKVLTIEGRYSYNLPEGGSIDVEYVADENGYVVKKLLFSLIRQIPPKLPLTTRPPPTPPLRTTVLPPATFPPPLTISPKAIGSILGK